MEFFKQTYFGNSVEAWTTAFGVILVSVVFFWILKRILIRRLGALAERTSTVFDDLLVDLITRTRLFSMLALSVYFATGFVTLPAGIQTTLQRLLILLLLIQGVIWGNRIISYWIEGVLRRRTKDDSTAAGTVTAVGFAGKLLLWSLALLLALDNFGFNITTLVAGLGIGGIAVALAVQNILGDVFASLSIVLDKPFVVGDFIVVGDFLGNVEHIGIKTTRLRSLSGEQIVFANGELLNSRIRNFKLLKERRILFRFGVVYSTPLEKLRSIGPWVRNILESQPNVRFDRVHFKEYGDSALIFEVVYFVLDPDYTVYMNIQEAINFKILSTFREHGVEFAFPTMTIVHEGGRAGTDLS